MTEEKNFWINKDEVGALSNAEGTAYKVKQEMMDKRGWYKLADDEQVVKKAVLSKEEAEWFEKYKDLPFYERTSSNYFINKLFYKLSRFRGWEKRADFFKRLTQAYFTGYTIKEKKYYIKLNFNRGPVYLNVNETTGNWFFETRSETSSYKTQFTQEKINEMQKDPRAKGLDLNVLKVEVPENELED